MQISPLTTCCFCLLTLFQIHFTLSFESTGFSLKLIHRDSPGSPLYPGNLTYRERMERLIRFSEVEGYNLENFSHPDAMAKPAEDLRFPLRRYHLNYLVETAIGSGRTRLYLKVDTGSGLIWTQCEPCLNCFNQLYPIYNPLDSTSYRKLTCDHPFCSRKNSIFRCFKNECFYTNRYGDKSSTRGVASLEKFLFRVGGTRRRFIDNIVFGCSNDNKETIISRPHIASGILGLSKAPYSLISQLSFELNNRFSYCYAPFVQLIQQPGILRFGDDIPPLSENITTTTFVTVPRRNFYYLNLLDISIGEVRLGFTPEQFEVRQDGSGGFIIDSGTVISRIDQRIIGERNAYDEVMTAFEVYYNGINLERKREGVRGFDLCYQYPPGFNDFATMTYHFEDADYHVESQYAHFPNDPSVGYFCVAIMQGDGLSILGTWHQQNMRIIYDGNIDALQFTPENCADDAP